MSSLKLKSDEESKKSFTIVFPRLSTVFSFFALIIAIGIGYQVYLYDQTSSVPVDNDQLTYWTVNLKDTNPKGGLRTIQRVYDQLGYREVNGSEESWNILWSVEFPFDAFPQHLKNVSKAGFINHIPGMTFLTNKKFLSVSTESKYIPVAFEFPRLKNEFIYYQKTFLDKKFVQKNFDNGGISIVPFEKMNYKLGEFKFVQEFIANPLLIDGHAFDLGVFVLITSTDPLRIYRWTNDIHLRFCNEPYHPFDPKNPEKFVVSNSHRPYWEMPTFSKYTNDLNMSAIDSFNLFLDTQQTNRKEFWAQVDDAIVSLILTKSIHINRQINNFKRFHIDSKIEFFELVRFDFLVDEKMKIHLMEINMSPALTPSNDRDERLAKVYEQLVYNTVTMIGVGKPQQQNGTFDSTVMLSHDHNIVVNHRQCVACLGEDNSMSCINEPCDLCLPCLPERTLTSLHRAYREHQKRGGFKRVFPIAAYSAPKIMKQFTRNDSISVRWFRAKCETDFHWC